MSEQLFPTQSSPIIYGHQTNIAGSVTTDGALVNAGTATAGRDIIGRDQIIFAAGIAAHTAVPLDTALAQVAALPTDHVPPVATLPAGSWMPLPANPFFVGRQAELLALATALKQGSTTEITPLAHSGAVAATGLGGMGKTQLASAFVHHYGTYFLGGVFWLSFADPTVIPAEVAQCAAWMNDLPPGVIHLPIPDQTQIVRRAWQDPLPRLLVFDNCEDPALLAQWRPTIGGCRVLITSRRARWSGSQAVTTVAVGALPRAESVALLTKFVPVPLTASQGENVPSLNIGESRGSDVLAEIAAELGDLPLALHMAGSYLAHIAYDMSPAAYLTELRRPGLLKHLSLQDADFAPIDHRLHVARTFALSYAQLNDTNLIDMTACHLLACAACFAPGEPLPRHLLRASAGLAAEESASVGATALARLVNLGLLEELTGGSLRLHRLLQHFVTDTLATTLIAAKTSVETIVLATARQLNAEGDPSSPPHLAAPLAPCHHQRPGTAR